METKNTCIWCSEIQRRRPLPISGLHPVPLLLRPSAPHPSSCLYPGLMCELLWSDPQSAPGRWPSKRGAGFLFGGDVTKRFLKDNKLDLIVRSHEAKDDGYEIQHDGKLITVFSAPNYCDQMGNKGAFIRFEAPIMEPKIVTFSAVPHPDVKPMAYASN